MRETLYVLPTCFQSKRIRNLERPSNFHSLNSLIIAAAAAVGATVSAAAAAAAAAALQAHFKVSLRTS